MIWQDIFAKEMKRRRRLFELHPDLYRKVWALNPKGLLREEDCEGHVWVPATHLMIHDEKSKLVLGGVKRRSFKEAYPYKDEDYNVVPQMCWNCDACRDWEKRIMTITEIQKEIEANRPKKERKKKYTIESSFDDLFDDVVL